MTRPTHRLIAHDAAETSPRRIELVVGDDAIARTVDGRQIASLGTDGRWYWLDGTPPSGEWRIIARTGPKPGERKRQLSVRLADGEIARVSLTAAQREAFERAAGKAGIGPWLRHLARRARRRAGESTSAWLARIGSVAADHPAR